MNDIVWIPPTLRELIPLTHLALELPGRDWVAELRNRGVEITVDDVGRPSVSRQVVRQLIQQQREAEARAWEVAQANDERFEQQRRAVPKGIPALDVWSPA